MTDDPFALTASEAVPRNWRGQPMIVPPDGGKPVAYTRATSYVGCLEDTTNLSKWSQRMVATGLARRPDLLLAASAHDGTSKDDKKALNKVCEEAREAAAASAAATTGTALHRLAERIDRGEKIEIPASAQADMRAYLEATAGMIHRHIETLMVNDELKVAGTPDRISRYLGKLYIVDLKTGSIEWGAGKIAMQLAMYAHSEFYDLDTHTRTPLKGIDLKQAVVVHLPAGSGTCTLHTVDIAAGWEAVQIARDVRAWRARKNLMTPIDLRQPTVEALIDAARSSAELREIWLTHSETWTDELTARATARKAALLATPLAS